MTGNAPVGLVAASGEMPVRLAESLRSSGRSVYIVALKGIADANFGNFDHEAIRLGDLSRIFDALTSKGCEELVFAGKLSRPKLADLAPDKLASRVILKLLTKGDNAALEMLAEIAADRGMAMVDKSAILDRHQAEEGLLAGPEASAGAMTSIERGKAVLEATGSHDIGQAVLVQGERIIAIEAAEGTDAMLARSAGLVDPDLSPAVLVKMLKNEQNRHLDPPVIGAATLGYAEKAGVAVVAIEAGGVLIADPDATFREARRLGISVIGVPR